MATKAQGCSCYDKAAPDEPIFVLRAQDKLAPLLVREWARLAASLGAPSAKVDEAYKCSAEMLEWQVSHASKVPD